METRVAVIGIIVEDAGSAERVNAVLHDYGRIMIGRMGIPYREKNIGFKEDIMKLIDINTFARYGIKQ